MTTEPSETKVEFDLIELLKGSVESVSEKLGQMENGTLIELHDLEEKGAKRVTLIDAIHREQKRRADADDAAETVEPEAIPPTQTPPDAMSALTAEVTAAMDADPNYPLGETDAMRWAVAWRLTCDRQDIDVDTLSPHDLDGWMVGWFANAMASARPEMLLARADATATYTQEQVDEMLAERDRVHAEALAKVTNAKAPKAAKVPTGKLVAFDAKAAPADAMKDGATVLFLDDAGHSLPGLPEPSFGAGEFERIGGAVRLKAPIDFPAHMKGAEIVGAALMVGGKAVGRAMLVLPFGVGNGRATRLQPGTLMFEPVASMDAAEADAA